MRIHTVLAILGVTALAILFMFGILTTESFADIESVFIVNSTSDATDADPGDGICETGSDNGICTLRAAVQEANALPGPDTIDLPAGTYLLTIAGGNENAAASGDLDVTDELTITGVDPASTIIDANGLDRVLDIITNNGFTLNNTTVQGGVISPAAGGGISSLSGSLTINNSLISDNEAVGGGGIALLLSGQLTLTNSTISNNDGGSAPGGGLYINAALVNISHSQIISNTAVQAGGFIINTGILTMTNSQVNGNTAVTVGGGFFNGADSLVISSTIQNNTAYENGVGSSGGGGGIMNSPAGTLRLVQSTVAGNETLNDEGGGVYNLGTLELVNSQVNDNLAFLGGGLFNRAGTLTLSETTVAENEAVFMGGGIWNESDSLIANSLIQGNLASDNYHGTGGGGGILNKGALTITHSSISGNNVNYANGGGLYNMEMGMVALENTQLTQNSSPSGGAIYSELATITGSDVTVDQNNAFGGAGFYIISSTLTLSNSTFSRNIATYEAGALLTGWGNGSFTNVTISENQAGGDGAAVYIHEQDFSILNSTLVSNTAVNSAIYISDMTSTLTLKNSIVAYNLGTNCSGFLPVSAGHNLESAADCGFTAVGDLINTDPNLGPLQNNGGSTETHLPMNASPTIDSADNVGCPALDQRGYARPYNLVCDIGSVESHFPEMPTPPTAVGLSGPTSGEINTVYTFTAVVSPISATIPITYVWQIEGQPPVTQTNGLTNTFLTSWADAGVYSMTVTAVKETHSPVSSSHQITITAAPISVPPTAVALSGPTSGSTDTVYTFTAVVSPISATIPITYVWQISGQAAITQTNGITDTFSVSWADAGEYSVMVTAVNEYGGPVTASQSIFIGFDNAIYLPIITYDTTEDDGAKENPYE